LAFPRLVRRGDWSDRRREPNYVLVMNQTEEKENQLPSMTMIKSIDSPDQALHRACELKTQKEQIRLLSIAVWPQRNSI